MCVPCAAPAMPVLVTILLIALAVIAGLGFGAWKMLPWVGVTFAVIVTALYRWFSGAVLAKDFQRRDDDHWDTRIRKGQRGPVVTRAVRATSRLALTGILVGLFVNPLATAIVCGTLSVTVSGLALYGRRDRIITTARQLTGRRQRDMVKRS